MVTMRKPPEEEEGEDSKKEEGGPAPPQNAPPYVLSFVWVDTGRKKQGGLARTGQAGLGQGKDICKKSTAVVSAVAETLPWPFRPHVAGYQIKDNTRSSREFVG